MQNAKDTFYEVLRARLAGVNPGRTVVVRGVTRPGVLVVENELALPQQPVDCFLLRWNEVTCDTRGALPTVTMPCEISYATAGTPGGGGTDRGRALAAMDAELLQMLMQEPQNAAKVAYSGGDASGATAAATGTRVWWCDAEFGAAKAAGERMHRAVTVVVMSFEEAGEL